MTETSKAYAAAMFDLAVDAGAEEAFRAALHLVRDSLSAIPGAVETLASPAIPKSERLGLLDSAFGEELPQDVMGFLRVLVGHGQVRELDACVAAFDDLLDTARKLATARVVSAVELTEAEKERLRAGLEKRLQRTIRLECSVDPALIGGMVVTVDGKVMDGSLRRRLHDIKEVMNG